MFSSTLISLTLLASTALAAPTTLTTRADNQAYCPTGYTYHASCSSGFVGCAPSGDTSICSGPQVFWGACGGHGNYYVCANGFKGCNTNAAVCDSKVVAPVPPPTQPQQQPKPEEPKPKSWSCPAGATYYPPGSCQTGFSGCTYNYQADCFGSQKYASGLCPAGLVYQKCGNGFVGCSPSPNMC